MRWQKKKSKKGKKYSGFHVIYGWMDHFWGDGDDEGEWSCVKKNKMIKDKKKKNPIEWRKEGENKIQKKVKSLKMTTSVPFTVVSAMS